MNEKFEAYMKTKPEMNYHSRLESKEDFMAGYLAAEAEHQKEVGELVDCICGCFASASDKNLILEFTRKALAPYKQVPCKKCGGSGELMENTHNEYPDEGAYTCPHCNNGHVWERRER